MAYFNWTDDLAVGNQFIDHDHQKLFDMVNRLHALMQEGKAKDVIGKVLNNLIAYTRDHFKREEDLMKQMRYDGYFDHKQEHEKLLKEVLDLQVKFDSGSATLSIQVLHFLRDWLLHHIGESDQALAKAAQGVAH